VKPTHFEICFQGMVPGPIEELWKTIRPMFGDGCASQIDLARHDPVTRSVLENFIVDAVRGGGVPTNAQTILAERQATFNFWASGQKVFTVSDALTKLLLQTDFKCAKAFLKLPFPCIYLRFEGSPISIWCQSDDTWLPLDGVYVYVVEDEYPDKDGVFAWTTKDIAPILDDPAHPLPSYKIPRLRFVAISQNEVDNKTGFRGNIIYTSMDWTCDDRIVIDEKYMSTEFDANAAQGEAYAERKGDFMAIMRLCLSAIAYINSSGSQVEFTKSPASEFLKKMEAAQSKGKAGKAARRAERRSKLNFYHVGRTITIEPSIAREGVEEVREGKVRYQKVRSQVRGHYRHYWLKKGNLSEADKNAVTLVDGEWVSVLKWLRPFWRGPEFATVVQQEYRVTKPE